MKINIVTVRSGWILQKIAERICQNAPSDTEMSLSHSPHHKANNFYVDITNCYAGKTGGKDVGLFTHVHENNMKHVPDLWFTLDHIVHMSRESYLKFSKDDRISKYQPAMTYKMPGEIPPGFDYEKETIGIFQRGQYEGKGFGLMKELAEESIAKDFKWIFVGNGWDEVISKLEDKTEVLSYDDSSLRYPEGYLSLYRITDYVLIPSKWEGGPMSLIEAAALGKKIIAPRGVGWCDKEIPIEYSYQAGSSAHLSMRLEYLAGTRDMARKVVETLSYEDYASYVADIFRGIK